jgi:hypothetical protein
MNMATRETMTADELATILPQLDGAELDRAIRRALADPNATEAELIALRAEYELRMAQSEGVTFQ